MTKKIKIIPVLKCKDMEESISFYTGILDFELKYPDASSNDWVVDLIKKEAEIQLSIHGGDGVFGCVINVWVDDIDEQFRKFVERGLEVPNENGSSVHHAPLNQTWGTREFYVTDPNGHTIRFCKPID